MSLKKLDGKEKWESYVLSLKVLGVFFVLFMIFIFLVGFIIADPFGFRATTTTTTSSTTSTTSSSTTSSSTTTVTYVTTTIVKTTTTSSTTTTTISTCYKDSDCGPTTEERVCFQENIYLQLLYYNCKNPGRSNAECVKMAKMTGQSMVSEIRPVEYCEYGFENATCRSKR